MDEVMIKEKQDFLNECIALLESDLEIEMKKRGISKYTRIGIIGRSMLKFEERLKRSEKNDNQFEIK